MNSISLRRGKREREIKIRSIRDMVLCVAGKHEKALSVGWLCLQLSTNANSFRSFPNLVREGVGLVKGVEVILSKLASSTVLKSPSYTAGTDGNCDM